MAIKQQFRVPNQRERGLVFYFMTKLLTVKTKRIPQCCFFLSVGVFFVMLVGCSSPALDDATANEEEVSIDPSDRLPQVFIDTKGIAIPDEPKIDATFLIERQDSVVFNGNIGIEIRGQSSQMFPKKQYGFETRDANNEDVDVSLLSLPEEEDWILHAPYSDKSLIRNALIYDLSRAIGRYSSRLHFVELTLNESFDGLYLLMEKLKRDKNRIDINKLKKSEIEGEDLTGGYIIKIDKETAYTEGNSFASLYPPNASINNQKVYFLFDTPDAEDLTPEQRNYITTYVGDFEKALASEAFTDPAIGYAPFIDSDSFVDFFLLNELANNVDGYRLSTWILKDKNKPIEMGPIWDFNLAFGNADYCEGGASDVWAYQFNERCPEDRWQIPFWWDRLLMDPAFRDKVKSRWQALRIAEFGESDIFRRIDDYVLLFEASGSRRGNFNRWPVLGTYVWPNNFVGSTHQEEIAYLKGWISNRLAWLDENIENL